MKKILLAFLMIAPLSIMAQVKFAHFNSADIIPNMKEYTAAQTEIQNMQKQYADDLKLMQDELQKKYEDYQKEASNLLEGVRLRREQELNELGQRYQQSLQDSETALQKATQEKMGAIGELVMAAVKKIGENNNHIYIIDLSTGSVSFVNPALSTDITDILKKELGITGNELINATPAK
jgi:outer membrane protein